MRSIARSRSCARASTSSASPSRWCRRSATTASSSSCRASTTPQRAEEVVQKSAFLQFQITDKTQALERAVPRLDGMIKDQQAHRRRRRGARHGDTARADTLGRAAARTRHGGRPPTPRAPPTRRPVPPQHRRRVRCRAQYLVAEADFPTDRGLPAMPEIRGAAAGQGRAVGRRLRVARRPVVPPAVRRSIPRAIITGDYLHRREAEQRRRSKARTSSSS